VSPARRGLLIFAIGAVIIAGVLAFDWWWTQGGESPLRRAAIGGPFTLTDQNGTIRHDTDFRGRLMLIYFGYTYCPDACPTTLAAMSEAMTLLGGKAEEVQPIFISVDPARDTVAQMKLYAQNFDPRLEALTGTPAETQAAAREYRVYFAKVEQAGKRDYLIDHSSILYVMGRDGRFLTHIAADAKPAAIAAALKPYL
jgi:cytochrome oxidase Cu insertion factor (SCO1/SenC/PrrC family)